MCERWVGGKQHLKKKFKDLLLLYKPAATAGLVFVLALWVCVCVSSWQNVVQETLMQQKLSQKKFYMSVCLWTDSFTFNFLN